MIWLSTSRNVGVLAPTRSRTGDFFSSSHYALKTGMGLLESSTMLHGANAAFRAHCQSTARCGTIWSGQSICTRPFSPCSYFLNSNSVVWHWNLCLNFASDLDNPRGPSEIELKFSLRNSASSIPSTFLLFAKHRSN